MRINYWNCIWRGDDIIILDYIKLLRPKQWYKNLLVFAPLIFAQTIFSPIAIYKHFLGFIALCLISSTNYIFNDLIDKEKDENNPEKKNRPIASGKVKIWSATSIAILLFILGMIITEQLSAMFFFFYISLFLLTSIYTVFLKQKPFIDILLIPINFVIRTLAGAYVIVVGTAPYVELSPWMVLSPFFLALFLAVGKRRSEFLLLKKEAIKHRQVLKYYNNNITSALMIISTSLLIISYALFAVFGKYQGLLYTIPPVLYIIFKLYYYAEQGMKEARHPEILLFKKDILIALSIITIIGFAVIFL